MQPFAVQIIPASAKHTTFVVVAAQTPAQALEQAARHGLREDDLDNQVVAVFTQDQVDALARAMHAAGELIARAA